jgi:hypothetical protein
LLRLFQSCRSSAVDRNAAHHGPRLNVAHEKGRIVTDAAFFNLLRPWLAVLNFNLMAPGAGQIKTGFTYANALVE